MKFIDIRGGKKLLPLPHTDRHLHLATWSLAGGTYNPELKEKELAKVFYSKKENFIEYLSKKTKLKESDGSTREYHILDKSLEDARKASGLSNPVKGLMLEIDVPSLYPPKLSDQISLNEAWSSWTEIQHFWFQYASTAHKHWGSQYELGLWNFAQSSALGLFKAPYTNEESIRERGYYSANSFIPEMAGLRNNYFSAYFLREAVNNLDGWKRNFDWRAETAKRQKLEPIPVVWPRVGVNACYLSKAEMLFVLKHIRDSGFKRCGIWYHPQDSWDANEPAIQALLRFIKDEETAK